MSMTTNAMDGETSRSLAYSMMAEVGGSPISRRHLHDELLVRLRDCIIDGELPPGAKIPEKDLCERFGVSRTPLREALKVLAFEGLVILNHNRGSIVKPLTLLDLSQAFPIYARLQALAGELACERLTRDEIAAILNLHERMVGYYEKHDARGRALANEQIHERIQNGSRNRNLIQLIRSISGPIRRARTLLNLPPSRLANDITEHERIMTALERRDAASLSGAIRDHIENTFACVKELLAMPERRGPGRNGSHVSAAQPV